MNNANPVSGDGLVSSYSFEQNNATHTFDTNNLVAGKYEEGGRFDGVEDYIEFGDTPNIGNIGTASASVWFNTRTLDTTTTYGGRGGIVTSSRVDILSNGLILIVNANTGWLSLDGISFRVAE